MNIQRGHHLRTRLLGLPVEAVHFDRRGFQGASSLMRERIECIGTTFLRGYHLALESDSIESLGADLQTVEPETRGFAFEGAAMGLALLDRLSFWRRNRVGEFLRLAGGEHVYMIHVGVGWVWARIPFGISRAQKNLDPLLRWLAFDGWGFHEGFFHAAKYISGRPVAKKLRGYEGRVYDQGLGRSFWFVNGGNVPLIARMISNFPAPRQPDLWSGIGLAATYAGMVSDESLQLLRKLAGPFHPQLAQGAAFAAKARERAGNSTAYVSLATTILCGTSPAEAARLTDDALENLPADSDEPAYEIWRRRIQNHLIQTGKLQEA